jgi:hypothetical protein
MEDCLVKAEMIDQYRRSCRSNKMNWAVREGQGYELSSISTKATSFLSDCVNSIPLYENMEIAILNSEADGGLPHTRPPNIVCLPEYLCRELPASREFRTTLLHEAIHVHQRHDPEIWERFCIREGWSPVSKQVIPEEFREKCRINPDTISRPFWAWESYHVPLPMFLSHRLTNISNTEIEWLDTRTMTVHHNPPPSFVKKYGQNFDQPEHPYEIYAEMFSEEGISKKEDLVKRLS